MKRILLTVTVACATLFAGAQTVITQWDFDADNTTPSIGSGTANLVGGTSEAFAAGNGGGRAWNTSTYPTQNTASGTAGVSFMVSTIGYEDISFSFDHRSSGTASRYAQFEYTTDGSSWNIIQNNNGGISPHDAFYNFSIDLSSCTACNDNPNFGIRIVSIFSPCEFVQNATSGDIAANTAYMRANDNAQCTPHTTANTGDYSTAGTWRFDNVTFEGTPLVPEISATPTTLANFTQFVGSPSENKTISVQGFNLNGDINITAPTHFEISTNATTGFGTSVSLTPTSGSVSSTSIYIRLNRATAGTASGNLELTSQDATTVNIALNGETIDADPDLLYYWHFNTLVTPSDVTEISADYKLIPSSDPKMTYTGTNTNGRDIDAFDTGSDLNLQLNELAGIGARVRNISDNRSLMFNMPTTGHSGLKFEYAVQRSGSGMLKNIVEYSIDGTTFTSTGMNQNEFNINETYGLIEVNFAGITAANDNANFKVRITFEGNTTETNGNNRFDNITLKKNQPLSFNTLSVKENALVAYPNPVSTDVVYFNKTITFEVYDIFGKLLDLKENTNTLNVKELPIGMYFVKTTKGETLKIVRN
jgi:hypothetical protein